MNQIFLNDILPIKNQSDYKIHLACWNGFKKPLDVFVHSWDEWVGWNTWKGKNDDFNREYIFSLIDFHHEPDVWLFGGIFKVTARTKNVRSKGYDVVRMKNTSAFIGRLKVRLKRPGRVRAVRMESCYDQITVSELLSAKYAGEEFRGYDNINHDFHVLENIYKIGKPGWKAALEKAKGIYLITDKKNGKRYIGSAYGDYGVWSRWGHYIRTGHGGNNELKALIRQKGIQYARRNFIFSFIEYLPTNTNDQTIIDREKHWKKVLLTRGDYGYNKN